MVFQYFQLNFPAVDRAIEKFNLELKELKQRLSHKRVLKGRLSAKESQVENLESQLKPGPKLVFSNIIGHWMNW